MYGCQVRSFWAGGVGFRDRSCDEEFLQRLLRTFELLFSRLQMSPVLFFIGKPSVKERGAGGREVCFALLLDIIRTASTT